MEGYASDDPVLDLLIVLEGILAGIEIRHGASDLKQYFTGAEGIRVLVFHQGVFGCRPAALRYACGDLHLYVILGKLQDLQCDLLHDGVGRGLLIRLGSFRLHLVQVLFDGLAAGEAAGVVGAYLIDARLDLHKVDIDEVVRVLRRYPFVEAHVGLIDIAVLLLVKLSVHAEVGRKLLVGGVEDVLGDLAHIDIALLHLLVGHYAVPAGYVARLSARAAAAAARRSAFTDGVRHGLARLDHRQIPVVIVVRQVLFGHIVPICTPGTQVDVVSELIVAVFIEAAYVDHVLIIKQARIYYPVRVLKRDIREPAALRHHGAELTRPGLVQTDRGGGHGLRFRVVLVPERDFANIVLTNVNSAADVPPLAFHVLVVAPAAGHYPPAVPVAVPPVEQCVAGPVRLRGQGVAVTAGQLGAAGAASGRFLAERGRIDGDAGALAAKQLLKLYLNLAGRISKYKGAFDFQSLAGHDIRILAVADGIERVLGSKNRGQRQLRAVLRGALDDGQEIAVGFVGVVGVVQRQDKRVVPIIVFHYARALV